MKKLIDNFYDFLPLYILGIVIGVLYYWAINSPIMLLICLMGPVNHVLCTFVKFNNDRFNEFDFDEQLEAADNLPLIQRNGRLWGMYLKLSNVYAIRSAYGNEYYKDYNFNLYKDYYKLAMNFREEFFKLKNESTDFKCLTDVTTVVIKSPCVKDDKFSGYSEEDSIKEFRKQYEENPIEMDKSFNTLKETSIEEQVEYIKNKLNGK